MSPQLPRSPTNMVINTIGLFCSLVVLGYVLATPSISDMTAIVAVCLSLAVPIIVLEAVFLKTYKNPSTGLDFSKPHQHWQFFLVLNKLLGLIATIAFVTLLYWIFPEYQGDFYDRYYQFLTIVMPLWLVVSVPYFFWVTRYMRQPKDGYWHMGKLVLLQWRDIDFEVIKQHLLGWLVKLFFLPLMFIYVFDKIGHYREADFAEIVSSFQVFFDFTFAFLFYIDLLFVTVGYLCTVRLFDAHIRTTEYSFLGWTVAIVCYQPIWSQLSRFYLDYDPGTTWGYWLWDINWLYTLWGFCILLLVAIYVWATLPFGIRFSNLTNRGILTNGPYRYTKHPAYISKNISWWMISMPFLTNGHPSEVIRLSLLLLALNFIYFMRARTEERHLSLDPTYATYAHYIERHGIFRAVGTRFPVLKFKEGQLFNTSLNGIPAWQTKL
ncbi:isoprenylcysteine carboxyl methyltransferase [Luminiphilus sp.]|nr:isoprenylcysteine carboxyl methyltransferase [Luminiphilus sp.]